MFRPSITAIFKDMFFEGYIYYIESQNNLIYKYIKI